MSEMGRRAVEKGFITESQLHEALGDASRPLERTLVERGFLTEVQLQLLRDEPGLLGKYRLLRKLGAGGMGEVWEAVDGILDRPVALKLLTVSPGTSPREAAQDEERFLREARLSARLPKHPHVVGVHEAGVAEGRRFLVMELIRGRHFGDWRRDVRGDLRVQVALLRDVALAVHHAHEHGIVHRDLKPQNILVDTAGVPHVTDFGLAKTLAMELGDSLTTSGMVVGTPSYMSPEQARGVKQPDRRSDVYSLGVLLYEILGDRTPFVAESAVEMLVKVIEHRLRPPSEICAEQGRPAPDAALELVALTALAKEPEARFATAREFAEALSCWLQAPARKAPRRWIPVAAALVLLGAAALWAFRPAPAPLLRPVEVDVLRGHAGAVNSVAFSADGRRLLSGSADRTARIWDLGTGAVLRGFGPLAAKVEAAAFSPDGLRIAACTEPDDGGGELVLWPSAGGAAQALSGHRDGVNALAFSRDGLWLASGDQQGTVRIWELRSGRERALWKAHAGQLRGAAFSPDGRFLATAGFDKRVVLWETGAGAQVAALEGHTEGVWAVAFSPDGRRLASASSDKTARIWDVDSRLAVAVLRGHGGVVGALAFSPDGRALATGSWDRTARLWDVESAAERGVLKGHGDSVWSVAFSPDGRRLATGSLDGTARLWPLPAR